MSPKTIEAKGIRERIKIQVWKRYRIARWFRFTFLPRSISVLDRRQAQYKENEEEEISDMYHVTTFKILKKLKKL